MLNFDVEIIPPPKEPNTFHQFMNPTSCPYGIMVFWVNSDDCLEIVLLPLPQASHNNVYILQLQRLRKDCFDNRF